MTIKCLNKNQRCKINKSQQKQRSIVKNDIVVNLGNKKLYLAYMNQTF